jgi:isocitrate dehydrogenase kinase/phosphatase
MAKPTPYELADILIDASNLTLRIEVPTRHKAAIAQVRNALVHLSRYVENLETATQRDAADELGNAITALAAVRYIVSAKEV